MKTSEKSFEISVKAQLNSSLFMSDNEPNNENYELSSRVDSGVQK